MAQESWWSGGNDRRESRVERQRERGYGGRMEKVERMRKESRWERRRREKRTRTRLVGWRFRRRRR